MNLRRVVIAWELGGQLGHLARLLPIARLLQADGVKVVFAVRHLESSLELLGSDNEWVFAQAPMAARKALSSGGAVNHSHALLLEGFASPQNVVARVAEWHRLFNLFQPDAVLSDFSPMSIYATKLAGIPVLPVGHGFEIPPNGNDSPEFRPWKREHGQTREADRNLLVALATLAGHFGTGAPKSLEDFYPSQSSALIAFQELDHFERPFKSSHYVGPIWSNMAQGPFALWPAQAGKKVLCYLRPEGPELDLLFQSLLARSCNVILVSPGLPSGAVASAREWGLEVHTTPVSIDALMEEAAAVITHGGLGLVSMALQMGVPLLIVPANAEQMLLAQRLVAQQLAFATAQVRHRPTVDEKIDLLLDSSAPDHMPARYRDKYAGYTPEVAVQKICRLLESLT